MAWNSVVLVSGLRLLLCTIRLMHGEFVLCICKELASWDLTAAMAKGVGSS